MNGPHGMYLMNLNPTGTVRNVNPPLEVIERLRYTDMNEGIRTVYLTVVDQPAPPGVRHVLANAFCDFVEFDYATRDAAAQWLLDWCNVKYGGGECDGKRNICTRDLTGCGTSRYTRVRTRTCCP